jgi:hypothetical protein
MDVRNGWLAVFPLIWSLDEGWLPAKVAAPITDGPMKRLIKNKMSFWLGCLVVPLGAYLCVADLSVRSATTLMEGIALILVGTIPPPRF